MSMNTQAALAAMSQAAGALHAEAAASSKSPPVIVGIYGIPGSGKTYLLHQLAKELGRDEFSLYEGSQVIDSQVPGGLEAFKELPAHDQFMWRERAIEVVKTECENSGKLGVVAGHFMFWTEGQGEGQAVYTPADLKTYTHILYLDVPADLVSQRCRDDAERNRVVNSVDHLRKWQDEEIAQLRQLCSRHNILFCVLPAQASPANRVSQMLRDFRRHTEAYNLTRAQATLDEILWAQTGLQTMLVFDADKTLTSQDTGDIFWSLTGQGAQQLKSLFGGPMGYTYTAFRQATLMYEEAADEERFDQLCATVASGVEIHAQFLALLKLAAEKTGISAVVVTSGLRRVWEHVLKREGLSNTVKVIGGGRISNKFVVTANVKAAIISRLKHVHYMYVVAFGDSPLDLPMLNRADEAYVVVGLEDLRSKTMDAALSQAIEKDGLRASQVLLPAHAPPRLNIATLPVVQVSELMDLRFPLWCRRSKVRPKIEVELRTASSDTAKLLMTPTRDASIKGPDLREAHRRIGWYLATEFMADLVGLEEYPIRHVQGHEIEGFRLGSEKHTLIVALMRGGEPMALGVSDALPGAMFLHAKDPTDVLGRHLDEQDTVIIVDSVVNSGKTVVQFARHIRALKPMVRIVVIAGVVQCGCVEPGGPIDVLDGELDISIIALRLSENKFTGKGTTDTGNRLFNTTSLE
ncbi:uracil phosphoribosyltransferase-domain-containing protein [Xylaria palmicola]|nr:uracil phosphoribosyltransferase-domain-containing protein [Xylaria palmicola]